MGKIFKIPGWIIHIVGGLWSWVICLAIIKSVVGFWGMLAGIVFFPITIYIAPFYAGFAQHNWFPLVLTYGSGIVSTLLIAVGSAIDKD